jgi:hypothetical protein
MLISATNIAKNKYGHVSHLQQTGYRLFTFTNNNRVAHPSVRAFIAWMQRQKQSEACDATAKLSVSTPGFIRRVIFSVQCNRELRLRCRVATTRILTPVLCSTAAGCTLG